MTEENKGSENFEVVRKPVMPDSLQGEGEGGNRSPGRTERDISNEPQEIADSLVSEQPDKVRDLVVPTPNQDLIFQDDDRSPTKTERGFGTNP